MNRFYLSGIMVLCVCVLIAAVLFFGGGSEKHTSLLLDASSTSISKTASSSALSTTAAMVPKRDVPAGSLEYHSTTYGISFFYPKEYSVKEFPGADGSVTVTFEYIDQKTASGFQLFITPFSGAQITDERFKEDEPSGVRSDLQNIKVDGVTGASFYGNDHVLGDTYEVWFIHNGYLYELTTFKELHAMLDGVAQSWEFF